MMLSTRFVEFSLRLYAALSISIYAVSKMLGYQWPNYKLPQTVGNSFQLTWLFFGYSRPFTLVIGTLQLAGSILLLIKRTRLIGVFVLTPIMVNIVLIDIFYKIPTGALGNAVFYLLCLFGIVYLNRQPLLAGLKIIMNASPVQEREKWWIYAAMIIASMMLLTVLNIAGNGGIKLVKYLLSL
jgi:hypothetical protein